MRCRIAVFALGLFLSAAMEAAADIQACFHDAARRYGVDAGILQAIAEVESGMNPMAIGRNRDGSVDIGLMQINSRWLSVLAPYGIRREDLYDPCVSIHVGAWILAQNIQRYGETWRAVGAYNAASESKRLRYVHRVAAKVGRTPPTRLPSFKWNRKPLLRVVGPATSFQRVS